MDRWCNHKVKEPGCDQCNDETYSWETKEAGCISFKCISNMYGHAIRIKFSDGHSAQSKPFDKLEHMVAWAVMIVGNYTNKDKKIMELAKTGERQMSHKVQEQSRLIIALNATDRFKVLEDGWIKDHFTGLEWGTSSDETMDLKAAIKYCAKNGGRLPEIQELHSLVNYAKRSPATFDVFKDTKTDDWYWSGTIAQWNKDCAWCVGFGNGNVNDGNEGNGHYVRPVRSSQ